MNTGRLDNLRTHFAYEVKTQLIKPIMWQSIVFKITTLKS